MESFSLFQRYAVYLLVFAAMMLIVYIIINMIQSFFREHTERKIKGERSSESMVNNIYYFVSRTTFAQLQLSWGILLSGAVVSILIFARVHIFTVILGSGALMFLLGALMPCLYYSVKVKKRAALFEQSMLDFSMGLTNALRAGQALPQAVEVFTRRCEPGPLKDELLIVQREYRLGVDLATALEHMHDRIPCEDLDRKSVV